MFFLVNRPVKRVFFLLHVAVVSLMILFFLATASNCLPSVCFSENLRANAD